MKLKTFSIITLISIFLVVVAGGVVRMTGSGMGCPDWPKCFDNYIPPTDASELPENYKDIYSEKRAKKIVRFGDFLTSLGFEKQAQALIADKSLLEEQDFSAFNTWTEYINRLLGALAGLLILIQTILAFMQFKKRKIMSFLALFLLFLTLFQAWFGAMVVATNIVPWVLTIHMMLAVLMIMIQLHIISIIDNKNKKNVSKGLYFTAMIGVLLMILQTLWGTQVRQQVDVLMDAFPRNEIVDNLEGIYYFHRSMAIAIIMIGVAFFYFARKNKENQKMSYFILGVVLLEGIVGKLFSVLGMPALLQPIHLVLSMVLFSLLYFSFINFKLKK